MNDKRLMIVCLRVAEEASEVAQAALKCVRFGMDDTYNGQTDLQRLVTEQSQLYGSFSALLNCLPSDKTTMNEEGFITGIEGINITDVANERMEKIRQELIDAGLLKAVSKEQKETPDGDSH